MRLKVDRRGPYRVDLSAAARAFLDGLEWGRRKRAETVLELLAVRFTLVDLGTAVTGRPAPAVDGEGSCLLLAGFAVIFRVDAEARLVEVVAMRTVEDQPVAL